MATLIIAEIQKNEYKKASFELATFAFQLQQPVHCMVFGSVHEPATIGQYGVETVHHLGQDLAFDTSSHAKAITAVVKDNNIKNVVFYHSSNGKSLAGYVAAQLKAGLVSAVTSIPKGGVVNKQVFSGKASVAYQITTDIKVYTIAANTFPPSISTDSPASVVSFSVKEAPSVKVISRETVEGKVPLPEAELVVSAGRGMKGPENWGIIEDLATALGATTACSRPVSDMDWRPHHEHVGQTGVAIKPNLYIAAGISGAIQHLGGVNNSKVIVVINKDPEAPFFKAADYGVVGDLFDVIPRLTAAIKKAKQS